MAADWIKMDVDLHEKRETLIIARECSIRPEFVVGLLHRVWGWADGQTTDGRVRGASFSDVDLIVCTPGFGDAMHAAGWLQKFRGGISFPHFVRHNGQSAKHRAMNTRRQTSRRKRDKSATNARADETREEERRGEKRSNARSSRLTTPLKQRTHAAENGACPENQPAGDHACVACKYPRELLRVVGFINDSAISPRRRQAVIDDAKRIATKRNPTIIWLDIVKRSERRSKNPGGYIANAMADEAKEN